MTLLEFVQEARRDFIEAGPEKHFACPSGHATGRAPGGRGCLVVQMGSTARRVLYRLSTFAFEYVWQRFHGEYPTETNERGYAACVDAYDQLVVHLEQSQTTTPIPTTEAIPA